MKTTMKGRRRAEDLSTRGWSVAPKGDTSWSLSSKRNFGRFFDVHNFYVNTTNSHTMAAANKFYWCAQFTGIQDYLFPQAANWIGDVRVPVVIDARLRAHLICTYRDVKAAALIVAKDSAGAGLPADQEISIPSAESIEDSLNGIFTPEDHDFIITKWTKVKPLPHQIGVYDYYIDLNLPLRDIWDIIISRWSEDPTEDPDKIVYSQGLVILAPTNGTTFHIESSLELKCKFFEGASRFL